MARACCVQCMVGSASGYGAAGGSLVHRRSAYLWRGERFQWNRRRRRRGAIAAGGGLGAHVQRLRTGRRFSAALRGDSRGRGRPAERRPEAGTSAGYVPFCSYRGKGDYPAGRLDAGDVTAAERHPGVEELRRQRLSAGTGNLDARPCAERRAHHRARRRHGVSHRASLYRRDSDSQHYSGHMDSRFLWRNPGRIVGARQRLHARCHGGGVPAWSGAPRYRAHRACPDIDGPGLRGRLDATGRDSEAPDVRIDRPWPARGYRGLRIHILHARVGTHRKAEATPSPSPTSRRSDRSRRLCASWRI